MPESRSPVFARIFLTLVCLLFVFVVVAGRDPAVYRLWNVPLGGWALTPFTDTGGVLAGADALRENGGRFSWDYLAAKGDPYNYPRLWSYAGWFGLGRAHQMTVGLVFTALVLLGQYRLLRPRDGGGLTVALLVLFSPGCLLLIERGNNDGFVFALVVAATVLLAGVGPVRRGLGGGLLLAAACLKLYPIAAIVAVPRRPGWRATVGAGVMLAIFGLYLFAVREDLRQITARTPRPFFGAYGGLVFASFVGHSHGLPSAVAKLGVDLSDPARRAAVEGVVRNVSFAVVLLLGGGAWLAGVRSAAAGAPEESAPAERDVICFRAGAAIYGGTFVIGNNWDYRMVFLSLTVPLLNGWVRSGGPALRRRALVVLGLVVFCLWGFAAPLTAVTFGMIQVATWTLFVFLAFLLGQLLPPPLRDPLRQVFGHSPAGALTVPAA